MRQIPPTTHRGYVIMSNDIQGPSKSDGLHTKIIHSSQSTSKTIVDNNTKDNKSLFYSTSSYLKKKCKLHFVFTPNQAPSIPGNSNTNLNSNKSNHHSHQRLHYCRRLAHLTLIPADRTKDEPTKPNGLTLHQNRLRHLNPIQFQNHL